MRVLAAGAIYVVGLVALGIQPGFADDRQHTRPEDFLLIKPNSGSTEVARLWVQLLNDASLATLAEDINLDAENLAKLNETTKDAYFKKGQWIVLPQANRRLLALSSYLDSQSSRETAPLTTSQSTADVIKITSGESVSTIAARHGLSLTELRKLNPGVNLARLKVGSLLRVSRPGINASRRHSSESAPTLDELIERNRIKQERFARERAEAAAKAKAQREREEALTRLREKKELLQIMY